MYVEFEDSQTQLMVIIINLATLVKCQRLYQMFQVML